MRGPSYGRDRYLEEAVICFVIKLFFDRDRSRGIDFGLLELILFGKGSAEFLYALE